MTIKLTMKGSVNFGKAIAKKFAEEGACVVINDINEERMKAAMEEFQKTFRKRLGSFYNA